MGIFDTPKKVDSIFNRARKGREFRLGNTIIVVGERKLHVLSLNGKGNIKSEAVLAAKHLVSYDVNGQMLMIYTSCSRETFLPQAVCPTIVFKPEEVEVIADLLGELDRLLESN